jgi:thiol-disulfide isomerase/thioredoxin
VKRRPVLLGAAALAVAAGAGTAIWRTQNAATLPPPPVVPDLWALTFERLDATPVAMASWRGRPLLLNFWATWCVPCVTEMPLLDRFAREHAASGWQVLALAIDQTEAVRRFLVERNISLAVALAGIDGLELSRALGNQQGALPFSAVFDSSGALVQHKLGAVSADLLSEWVSAMR